MDNLGNEYTFCKELTDEIIEILEEENRFESIEKSMPDMITCKIHNSWIFPDSSVFADTKIIQCVFCAHANKTVFSIVYYPADDCQNIINRLNKELPNVDKPINYRAQIMSVPVNICVLDDWTMYMLAKIKDRALRKKMLKFKLDYFFRRHADKIIGKILEIMLNVVI